MGMGGRGWGLDSVLNFNGRKWEYYLKKGNGTEVCIAFSEWEGIGKKTHSHKYDIEGKICCYENSDGIW